MSTSGTGRGRGWLNLKQSQSSSNQPSTVGAPNPNSTTTGLKNYTAREERQFADADDCDLVNRVKQLDVNDDGILFNQKLKFIQDSWKYNCQTAEEVEQSFDTLYQTCLNDEELASKLVLMVVSHTFIKQEVHGKIIRDLFLHKLQNTFDNSKNLRKTNQIAFWNSVRLLGGFYNKARVKSGLQINFMAMPFMSCLEMLLEEGQLQDLQLFTTQLYLNGSAVKSELPDNFTELINNVRLKIAFDPNLSKEGRLWLLLALEVVSNRFGILPGEVNKFYEDQLGDSAMASFQGTPGTLTVQTVQENNTLDNYQSNVNVLQVSASADPPVEPVSSPVYPSHELNSTLQSINNSSGFVSDSSNQNSFTLINRTESGDSSKHGRPILGVGARLNKIKDEVKNSKPSWGEGDSSFERNHKPNNKSKNSGWGDDKKNKQKNTKAWQHDDRFEINYN